MGILGSRDKAKRAQDAPADGIAVTDKGRFKARKGKPMPIGATFEAAGKPAPVSARKSAGPAENEAAKTKPANRAASGKVGGRQWDPKGGAAPTPAGSGTAPTPAKDAD